MNNVRTQSGAVAQMAVNWPLITALLGGSPAMRKMGVTFMPIQPREDQADWQYRLDTATLYPAFERTVEVLAGKPFSKQLIIGENVPARMQPWMEAVDQRRNLHVFAASVLEEAMAYGIAGILVDHQPTLDREGKQLYQTKAAEAAAGVRPYFVHIHARNILGWRSATIAGREQLTQLRLLEQVEADDGEFGTVSIEQVRVLYPGRWELWRQGTGRRKTWELYEQGATSLKAIPFVPVYGKQIEFMVGKPPLLSLAEMNRDHWRESSDQRDSVRFARKRLLVLTGVEEGTEIVAGANYAVKLPQGADAKILQGSAESVKIGRDEINTIEEQMRQAGAEMLVIRPGKITATQTSSEDQGNLCAMQRIALDLEDALDAALMYMAQWVGEPNGGNVTVFKDFGATTMAEASMQVIAGMNVSDETKFEEAQRRGIISPDRKWADERDRLDAQGPAPGTMTGADDGIGK